MTRSPVVGVGRSEKHDLRDGEGIGEVHGGGVDTEGDPGVFRVPGHTPKRESIAVERVLVPVKPAKR